MESKCINKSFKYLYVMKLPTPEHIKSEVIDAWLMGKTRDNIASEYNIGTGSVSNIIE
jgi:hypothetical protein